MMQSVFKCDTCKRIIGDKPHVSLGFGQYSGIAVPPSKAPLTDKRYPGRTRWKVEGDLQNKFVHFCSTEHLKKYFDGLMAKATKV